WRAGRHPIRRRSIRSTGTWAARTTTSSSSAWAR
ncbi:MAG: hypothetical protein AVDCRST_MAG13-2958, partial [uncultured Solirubrobacteraceae bacterium]